MKVKMNENRVAIVNVLSSATAPMTLAEISEKVGFEVKTGTTNTMVKAGILVVAGERTIKCPCCGHKHVVKEYSIGTIPTEEVKD